MPDNPPSSVSWTDLFTTHGAADCQMRVRVLKKSGQPFLILPASNALAARALELYPAQTGFARTAKSALRTALRFGLPCGLQSDEFRFSRNSPFANFLARLGGEATGAFPQFAILAGNPHAEGRRFIVLVFDTTDRPACVVKAGIGAAAARLVEHEASFLKSVPGGISGLPKLLESFDDERVKALAMEYAEGNSPRGEQRARLEELLSGWIDRSARVRATDLAAWQRLARERAGHPLLMRLSEKLSKVESFPALYHGDFAPWNIKVSRSDGSWHVLDWERGERAGFPGWDWFHYEIQRGALAEKLAPDALMQKLEELLASPEFKAYAGRAAITGNEKMLAVAYLFYCVEILRQSEGMDAVRGLLAQAEAKWLD